VVWYGDRTTVTAAIVYGLGLIAMLAFSASYHLVSHPHAKAILRRFDHAAIYVKIAATYTLFAILLARPQAASILSPIWTAAAVGLALKLAAPRRLERVSLALYLTMGWAIVIIGGPILDGLSAAGLLLVLAGGGVYTVGVIFLLWERLKFHNAIWHGLVLAASVLLYAAVLVEVAGHAPIA
jgi:hemolysin III